jgi:predicted Zn-dependent protease
MLADASGARDGDRIPGFLSTHPDPLSRRDRILDQVAAGIQGERVDRDPYLQRLEGMIFGTNPRHGYFEGPAFLHPDMAFRLDFPGGWRTVNGTDAVQGMSQEEDAVLVLALDDATSPQAARAALLQADGITGRSAGDAPINGLPAARADFTAATQDGTLEGTAAFVAHGGRVFRILGLAVQARWSARSGAIRGSVGSFRPVTDPSVLNIEPDRVTLVRTPGAMTLEAFHERYPSTIPIEQLGTINRLRPGATIPAGTLVKRVVRGP